MITIGLSYLADLYYFVLHLSFFIYLRFIMSLLFVCRFVCLSIHHFFLNLYFSLTLTFYLYSFRHYLIPSLSPLLLSLSLFIHSLLHSLSHLTSNLSLPLFLSVRYSLAFLPRPHFFFHLISVCLFRLLNLQIWVRLQFSD